MNIEQEANRLQQLWSAMFRELKCEIPRMMQFYTWLAKYHPKTIGPAILSTMQKAFYLSKKGELMDFNYQCNYAAKIMKVITQEQVNAELKEFGIAPDPIPEPAPIVTTSKPKQKREMTDQEMMEWLERDRNKLIRETQEREARMWKGGKS